MTTHALYRRRWRVRLGDLVFSSPEAGEGLGISFEVEKQLWGANKGKVTVYNLNRTHRASLAGLYRARRRIRVELSAGYGTDEPPLIFVGDLRGFDDSPSGVDTTATVEGVDGGQKIAASRISQTFPEGSSVAYVAQTIARAMLLGDGNIRDLNGATLGGNATLPRPIVCHGLASAELTAFLRSLGFSWSIQNGAIQVLRGSAPLRRSAIRLNPSTGLIEASYTDRRTIRVLSFLIPEIAPGVPVIVESQRVNGDFRAHAVKFSGDSRAGDWIADIQLRVPRPLTLY